MRRTWLISWSCCSGAVALCCLQGQGVYPGPLAELDFWSERAGNLNAIHEQLSNERIQKVVKILELANSTYYQAFQRLFKVRVGVSCAASALDCCAFACCL